jgi:biopolymer transport protein ExbB
MDDAMDLGPTLDAFLGAARPFWESARTIWIDGGWAMAAIAANALVLFGLGFHLLLALLGKSFGSVPETTWRGWLDRPEEGRGTIGRIVASIAAAHGVHEAAVIFEGLRKAEIAPLARDLQVMRICVGAAPLLGLLGTVTGMLATFDALANGSGGEKTMGLIAEGISEALITTETGLVIALPGLFFQYLLARLHERHEAFLAHVETVCTQHVHRGERARAAANARETSGRAEITPSPRTAKVARAGAPLPLNR